MPSELLSTLTMSEAAAAALQHALKQHSCLLAAAAAKGFVEKIQEGKQKM